MGELFPLFHKMSVHQSDYLGTAASFLRVTVTGTSRVGAVVGVAHGGLTTGLMWAVAAVSEGLSVGELASRLGELPVLHESSGHDVDLVEDGFTLLRGRFGTLKEVVGLADPWDLE